MPRGGSMPDSEAWIQGTHTFDISFCPPKKWQCQPRFTDRTLTSPPWEELKATLQGAWMQEGLTNVSAINPALNVRSLRPPIS